MIIYHNPRCRKSRETLAILQDKNQKFEVREYLKKPLTKEELIALRDKLEIPAEKMIRKNEPIFKDNYKGASLNEEAYIEMMVEFPILMERPVVENGEAAVIGRPPENVISILS